MKKDIHPKYQPVIFKDIGADFAFLSRSTKSSDKMMKWEDGNEYPVLEVEISSATHPFFTGKQRLIDSAGRIEKFQKKYQQVKKTKK